MLRPYGNRPNAVKDLRWETRLLALVAAILVVFGLTAVYGASSLLTISGGQVGSSFALKQALGAAVGGIGAALRARPDCRAGAPGGASFVCVGGQPGERASSAVVLWTALLAAKRGERIRRFQYGLLP